MVGRTSRSTSNGFRRAAGNIALGLAFGALHEVWGSGAQLLINVSGMAIAGWATLAFQHAVWSRMSARRARRLRRRRGRQEPEGA